MAIEIVEFPTNSMVIFQFAMLVYQRVTTKEFWKTKKQHVKKKTGRMIINHRQSHMKLAITC
jgi:hypothetical protein